MEPDLEKWTHEAETMNPGGVASKAAQEATDVAEEKAMEIIDNPKGYVHTQRGKHQKTGHLQEPEWNFWGWSEPTTTKKHKTKIPASAKRTKAKYTRGGKYQKIGH